jgi:hypothetical protein
MRGRLSFQPTPTPDVRRSEPSAKSLFWNILRVTHLDPIFCEHKCASPASNLSGFNILGRSIQKTRTRSTPSEPSPKAVRLRGRLSSDPAPTPDVRRSEPAANSLLWNILRVTHLDPIFCEYKRISPVSNFPEFNILRSSIRNSWSTRTTLEVAS